MLFLLQKTSPEPTTRSCSVMTNYEIILTRDNIQIPHFVFSADGRDEDVVNVPTTSANPFATDSKSGPPTSTTSSTMRCADLKRAVEDVILRPDENRLDQMKNRGTIAALDLCRLEKEKTKETLQQPTVASMNASSSNGMLDGRPPPPLCASSSLDTIIHRPQSYSQRHSTSSSRRPSRVVAAYQTKRKRSNSLTNYNKGQALSVSLPPSARATPLRFVNDEEAFRNSLGSSESHSSMSRSEDYAPELVLEEEENGSQFMVDVSTEPSVPMFHSFHSVCSSTSSNPFTTYRETREEDMDCD